MHIELLTEKSIILGLNAQTIEEWKVTGALPDYSMALVSQLRRKGVVWGGE